MELSAEEIDAFNGLNESYVEMEKKLALHRPKCHFKPMRFDIGEEDSWWECDYCGHTKPA